MCDVNWWMDADLILIFMLILGKYITYDCG
jgi:hypothetical protein